jgi:hypothetical protein
VVLLPPTNGTCTYAQSDDNIYQNTPRASKRAYSISCIATFLAKKIVSITYGVTWYYQNVYRINDGDYKPSKFRCRAYQSQFALTQMITLDEPEIMVRSAAGATDSALLQCPGRL